MSVFIWTAAMEVEEQLKDENVGVLQVLSEILVILFKEVADFGFQNASSPHQQTIRATCKNENVGQRTES